MSIVINIAVRRFMPVASLPGWRERSSRFEVRLALELRAWTTRSVAPASTCLPAIRANGISRARRQNSRGTELAQVQ